MFVLRPGWRRFNVEDCETGLLDGLYGDFDWVYNVRGVDGGKFISNNSGVDAYRLAIQYGLSDAVIVGSNVVSNEGVRKNNLGGYLWQPYEVCKWQHLHSLDPKLESKIEEQRGEWQKLGVLSKRKYPAQIVVTWNGDNKKANSADFLAGRIFHEFLPNGEPIETYIITSEVGATNVLKRAKQFGLERRINDMLVVLPPPPIGVSTVASTKQQQADQTGPTSSSQRSPNAQMDLSLVPKLLYDKYDIRIANHDGGQGVLLAFARAGALSQLNLTLCKHKSVADVLWETSEGTPNLDCNEQSAYSAEVDKKFQYFFRNRPLPTTDTGTETTTGRAGRNALVRSFSAFERGLPVNLPVASVIEDACGDVAIVTLKTDYKFDFHADG